MESVVICIWRFSQKMYYIRFRKYSLTEPWSYPLVTSSMKPTYVHVYFIFLTFTRKCRWSFFLLAKFTRKFTIRWLFFSSSISEVLLRRLPRPASGYILPRLSPLNYTDALSFIYHIHRCMSFPWPWDYTPKWLARLSHNSEYIIISSTHLFFFSVHTHALTVCIALIPEMLDKCFHNKHLGKVYNVSHKAIITSPCLMINKDAAYMVVCYRNWVNDYQWDATSSAGLLPNEGEMCWRIPMELIAVVVTSTSRIYEHPAMSTKHQNRV